MSEFSEKSSTSKNRSNNRTSRRSEFSKQQVLSITYEEIGLFPRSFNRVFDRFFKQLFFDVENLVIQEYRFYRYLFLTTVKCLFILITVPLTVNFIAKTYLVRSITEYYWNTQQSEIFLNSYQQKRAYKELHDFEEKIFFDSLILSTAPSPKISSVSKQGFDTQFSSLQKRSEPVVSIAVSTSGLTTSVKNSNLTNMQFGNQIAMGQNLDLFISSSSNKVEAQSAECPTYVPCESHSNVLSDGYLSTPLLNESIQKRLQQKTIELAIHYNEESIEVITNFFADMISFGTLCILLFNLEIQINITKSFLLEVFFGLDDSKKSLFILFLTDLLVGYHSPNIWELFFQSLFDHYGLPESETTIFLLVATLPVLLDVLFKYLIFRHLNRASPATVATYHAMIE
jgi:hypothetical protein